MRVHRSCVQALLLAMSLWLVAAASEPWPVLAQDAPGSAPPVLDYELVDEWGFQPWQRRPGLFSSASDVTSLPDGRRLVLDAQAKGIHRLSADGTAWDFDALPRTVSIGAYLDRSWSPHRLDVGPDGLVALLGQVDRLREDDPELSAFVVLSLSEAGRWQPTHLVELERKWTYADLALGPADRAYLTRYSANRMDPRGSIDVLAPYAQNPSGATTRLAPQELGHPYRVDVHADGTIYVLSALCNCSPPPPPPPRTPRPTRTPRPSLDRGGPDAGPGSRGPLDGRRSGVHTAAINQRDGEGTDGIVVIGPDGRTRETWTQGSLRDVAVTGRSALVHNASRLYRVDGRKELHRVSSQYAADVLLTSIDVAPDGRVNLVNGSSAYMGLFVLPSADASSASPRGWIDHPRLEGPLWPRAISVDESAGELLVVDQQLRQGTGHHAKSGPHYGSDHPATLHRWKLDGTLSSQSGMIWQPYAFEERPVDVAVNDGRTITLSDHHLILRRDHALPVLARSFPGQDASGRSALLAAVDAHEDRIAVLDIGRERVLVLSSGGGLQSEWSTWSARPNALPADLALFGDRLYLADRGRNRIMVRGIGGADLGEWPTHDGPLRVETGPHGDVFVLGRGGWLLRYTPDGTLVSWWRLPSRDVSGLRRAVTPGDLDVDRRGRVYVSWWVEGPKDTVLARQAGISVFASILRPAPEGRQPLRPGACLAEPDKRAVPGQIRLGETVDVTLTLRGECPGTHRPSQVMIVFDRSRSIEWNGAMLRAKEALVGLLDTLNGEAVEIGLVSFADGAALEVPLTDRLGEIRGRIATLDAGGDTRMAAGIDLARRELLGPRHDPEAEPHIWIVSDGVFKDQPTDAVAAAQADGIIVDALIFRTHEFGNEVRDALRALVGGAHLHEELRPEREIHIVRQITAYDPQRGLFDTLTLDDVIPSNMRLVPGSVEPAAALTTTLVASDTLRWRFEDVLAADPLTLTYTLEPLELGTHPTNVEARADWIDAWDHAGRVPFPVPVVEVLAAPTPTPAPEPEPVIYLPFASRHRCHRRAPLDIVLTVDTSGSMGRPVVGQPGTALDVAREAMRDFVRLLDMPRDRLAVVEFNATARVISGLSGDHDTALESIDALRHSPGSRLDQGLALAAHALDGAGDEPGRPVVILLTDGQQYESRKIALAWGGAMRGRAVTVWAVGFGPDRRRGPAAPPGHHP